MFENFNEDKRKNSMTQFSDFHTGWSIKINEPNEIYMKRERVNKKVERFLHFLMNKKSHNKKLWDFFI